MLSAQFDDDDDDDEYLKLYEYVQIFVLRIIIGAKLFFKRFFLLSFFKAFYKIFTQN